MSLSLYKKKRNFSETPEPEGKQKSSKEGLRFVVQKHDASSLHYDFRLEMEGVLKSWAVPKGPSLNPADKRLAMMVEDHPYDYRNFEGVIPEGNYGGGTVIVWGEGTYEPVAAGGMSKAEQEKTLLKGLRSGSLKFILHGKKLTGAFTLFQIKRDASGKSWILVKKDDEQATSEDVTRQMRSVKTGKTLAQVAEEAGATLKHPEAKLPKPQKAKATVKRTSATKRKISSVKKPVKSKRRSSPTLKKTSGLQLRSEDGTDLIVTVSAQELQLTNLNKLYWQKEKGSKRDLINHYFAVAPYMLPYMLRRPQSLHRYPNGIDAPSFYQKDVRGKVPDWIETFDAFSESTEETIQYMVCKDEATLIYMANLGCIEMHPWHSRVQWPLKPDWCLIDLDPEGIGFDKVIECAQVVKKVLDAIGAEGYPKTSGSTGIHIYIPLGAQYDYDQSKQFAELIVTLVHKEIPSYTSLERTPAKRKRKIYLDYLQNRETQTAAAPYSLRPKRGMPVSTPLHWDEVKKGLKPTDFHLRNIMERLKTEGDLFKPVLGKGINLRSVLRNVQSILS